MKIHGALGLRDAADLSGQLTEALARHPDVTVDAAALEDADVAILQVLVAAQKTADGTGRALRLHAPPGGVLPQLLARAGLTAPDGTPRLRSRTDTDAKGTPA